MGRNETTSPTLTSESTVNATLRSRGPIHRHVEYPDPPNFIIAEHGPNPMLVDPSMVAKPKWMRIEVPSLVNVAVIALDPKKLG